METKNIAQKTLEYTNYIIEHITNVERVFGQLKDKLASMDSDQIPEVIRDVYSSDYWDTLVDNIKKHDESKFSSEEFSQYRAYFYPTSDEEKLLSETEFEKAWDHHKVNNTHHPEGRRSIFYPGKKDYLRLVIDIIENVCDWGAMSIHFKEQNYSGYYNENKDKHGIPADERVIFEALYEILEGGDK